MTEPDLYGRDLFGEPIKRPSRGMVADRFVVPPFSVLSAREGWWQDRKRAWMKYGIASEIGRGDDLCYGNAMKAFDKYRVAEGKTADTKIQGTSIFDPVLCELAYRWFCPKGGQIVDPFAGGSVRGIVASLLGREYWGCDLSEKQIAANRVQGAEITPDNQPTWVCGDSTHKLIDAPQADFIFSCPPYGDLEVYSDDHHDLSTMPYGRFCQGYRQIIGLAMNKLKMNRFAAFVIGDFRDKNGFYRGFVSETEWAFKMVGGNLYNEVILVTAVGSLPIRITRQFNAGRKLGKTHQNMLIFCKGDPKKATQAIKAADGDEE